MTVLAVDGVYKSFRTYRSEVQRVASWFGVAVTPVAEKAVLKDIGFSVASGEAVGIVGQNGAGKSTLLKIIAGTMQPTSGTVSVTGRVSALLELGMGFNPDLTGRANVWQTGGLMGLTRERIAGLLPEIEAFAEVGAYFDEPLRVYSSGMQVRLAFAVATAVRPDVLIVDEALSVGDSYFQHKSFNRIREFRQAGTTLLLVSHDRSAITSLCDRAILLEKGDLRLDGAPEDVLDLYNALIAAQEGHSVRQAPGGDGRMRTISGTGEARIERVTLLNGKGVPAETLTVGERATLEIAVGVVSDIPELVVGYMIKDRLGTPVFGTNSLHLGKVLGDLEAGAALTFRFSFLAALGAGNFSIAVSLHQSQDHLAHNYEWQDLAVTFSVVNLDHPSFVGTAWLPPEIEIEPKESQGGKR